MATLPGIVRLTRVSDTSDFIDVPTDTSFEPYRREAYRTRSQETQREGIATDNIVGEGMLNASGLWRRNQIDWSMGAGAQYLDSKRQAQENRFYQSKGIDVFSFPMQATLLPDTYSVVSNTNTNLIMSRCGDYVVVAAGGTVKYYNSSWSSTSCTYGSTYGGSAWSVVNSIATNDTYCFLATDTGIWFCQIGASGSAGYTFQLYASPDTATGYTGGYDLVRWANDQLVASRGARLYAFQPRSATTPPLFGSGPSLGGGPYTVSIITNSSGTATAVTSTPNSLVVGDAVTFQDNSLYVAAMSAPTASGTAITISPLTAPGGSACDSGFQIGDAISLSLTYGSGAGTTYTDTGIVSARTSTSFTYTSGNGGLLAVIAIGSFAEGNATNNSFGGYNQQFKVTAIVSSTSFQFAAPTTTGYFATGGTTSGDTTADVLFTHSNPNYVWSDAASGQTVIYFGGYIKSSSGAKYSGSIYRSDLLGSSTTSATGTTTVSNSTVAQPWALDTPVQALPMSPDEVPLCVKSYLNYIFIGSNRGIRMAQTLSIYDPTATSTGDLKAGPLSPNILQPVGSTGVTSIVGDGRYVWFAWNNYDSSSTGLGKLDLSTFIDGDPLAPAYASDLMVTGQGVVNSLDWDPINNVPLMAVQGLGIYKPYATNDGGNLAVTKYIPSGTITSGLFDYGIADPMMPVSFIINAIAVSGSTVTATIVADADDPTTTVSQTTSTFVSGDATEQYLSNNTTGTDFQVTMTLTAGTSNTVSPILKRWALKSWPTAIGPDDVMLVINLFGMTNTDGIEGYVDPYYVLTWLRNRRKSQEMVTYSEGPISVNGVIRILDWLPHSDDGTYEAGFRGDLVATFTTLSDFTYTPTPTS